MYRTNTCGELRLSDCGKTVTLAGWVQRTRKMGGMTFVDLRDRYGITQLVFNDSDDSDLCARASKLGREFCVQVTGVVNERESKNANLPTGDIEIIAKELNVLSESVTPPFTIEDNTDGGDDIRMKYRYLDLRRPTVRKNLELRHRMTILIRNFLDAQNFIEVETPILIGSTPEGARDFVVPSRMNPGQFYALPQSPQTLKQLLMISGFDRYFQIAKCFRDEDLRADRQPEFTQIDCEMSFVDQDDVINLFEDMARHLFKEVRGVELPAKLQQMTWHEAMRRFGSDKPDLRFGMEFVELMDVLKGTGTFSVFNEAEYIGGICVPGCADYTRKQLDQLTDFVKRPQIGAKGLVYIKFNADGTVKSSVDKFYTPEVLAKVKETTGAKDGDLVLILSGDNANKTRVQLCSLRLEMGDRLGLRDKNKFECLWIIDFPLFEWSDEEQRLMATHHPFTMPNPDDIPLLDEHRAFGRGGKTSLGSSTGPGNGAAGLQPAIAIGAFGVFIGIIKMAVGAFGQFHHFPPSGAFTAQAAGWCGRFLWYRRFAGGIPRRWGRRSPSQRLHPAGAGSRRCFPLPALRAGGGCGHPPGRGHTGRHRCR